jgi:acid phosphatase
MFGLTLGKSFVQPFIIILILLFSAGCSDLSFFTAKNNIQFFIIGDQGTGGMEQRKVAQAMAQEAIEEPVQFVVLLGDNFYPSGVKSINDQQWNGKFEDMYSSPSLQVPFYAVLGNHDYRENPLAQVSYSQKSSQWKMPDEYYTFSFMIGRSSEVRFFAIDTTLIVNKSPSSQQQIQWLERELRKSQAHWKIVYGHHHIYSYGYYGENNYLKDILDPLFQ